MPVTVLLPEGLHGPVAFGHAGDPSPNPYLLDAGAPGPFKFTFPSAQWTNLANEGTIHLGASLERSLDSGLTWQGWGGFPDAVNVRGKNNIIHPPEMGVAWDGQACLVRGQTIVPVPFSYGVTLTSP